MLFHHRPVCLQIINTQIKKELLFVSYKLYYRNNQKIRETHPKRDKKDENPIGNTKNDISGGRYSRMQRKFFYFFVKL